MCENTYIGVWSFRPGFSLWHTCHVVRHGHFTLKQLRLPVLYEMHTNSCTGPRLYGKTCNKCKKLHHFANVRKAREVNVIDKTAEEPDQHLFIGTLNSSETKQPVAYASRVKSV